MESACTLHDDLLKHIAQWLDSRDIIALKDSCQTFRKFVGLYQNTVSVSTVLLDHIIGFDASGSSKQRSVLELFVTVGHGAETSQKSEIQLGRSAVYCTNMKFWNFVCPRQQIHLEGGDGPVPLSVSDSQELFLDNLLVPFLGLQELKIRSRDLERIFGIVNARNVVLACPGLKIPAIVGDQVRHLDFLVPTSCPDALQFEGDPRLESFCLQICPQIDTSKINSGRDVWGIRQLKKCTSLKMLTLDMWNCCSNADQWTHSLNGILGVCINAEHLQTFVCLGALNSIQPNGLFWKRMLGITDVGSSAPWSLEPKTPQAETHRVRKSLSLTFGAQDDAQGMSTSDFRDAQKLQMTEMANQFMQSPRLSTLSFELCLRKLGSTTRSCPALHSYNLSNLLAMATMKALCTQKCSNLTHLLIFQPLYPKTVKDMVASHTADLEQLQNCLTGCPETEEEGEFCYGKLVSMFPAVVQNGNGVPFIKTDVQFDTDSQCNIVEAISKNPSFCRFELESSTKRLTYAIYRQRRSQRLERLCIADQSPGTTSNVSLLSRKDFEAVVHRKLVYVESRVETLSDETDRKTFKISFGLT